MTYETSAYGQLSGTLVSPASVGPGHVTIGVDLRPVAVDRGAPPGARRSIPMFARLSINGAVVAGATALMAASGDTLDIGSDLVSPVSPKYVSPFSFNGRIEAVTVDLTTP